MMKMSDLKPSVVRKTFRVRQGNALAEQSYQQPLSITKINAAEKAHNENVAKLARENYGIPVVFGGMNTV